MLEVIKVPEKTFVYPVARRHLIHGYIVVFFSEDEGVVMKAPELCVYQPGDSFICETNWFNPEMWVPVNITITG